MLPIKAMQILGFLFQLINQADLYYQDYLSIYHINTIHLFLTN
jgi:hypothetical protein